MAQDMVEINKLFAEHFAKHLKAIHVPYSNWTVDDWMEHDISASEKRKYKNAKKAFQVRNSKLNKILG